METTSEIVIFANFMSSLRDTESLTHCTIMRLHYTSHSIDTCHSKLQAHVTHSSNLAKNLSTQFINFQCHFEVTTSKVKGTRPHKAHMQLQTNGHMGDIHSLKVAA